jgi:hypothetical protein
MRGAIVSTRTRINTLYAFSELSDDAQRHALDKLRDLNADHEWWEFTYDDAKQCAAILGIEITRIYFSGFSSQGDGACFKGSYNYAKGAVKAIREHTGGTDAELERIARELQSVQRSAFYKLSASVKHSGHYYHEMCTRIEVSNGDEYATESQTQAVKEALRDFMRWIYRRLEKEYEYLTSDEQITESIEANEYEFTEDGDLA